MTASNLLLYQQFVRPNNSLAKRQERQRQEAGEAVAGIQIHLGEEAAEVGKYR